jgi:hypothetical protein
VFVASPADTEDFCEEGKMDYFRHDINSSEDDKICELLAIGGYELFGYYWRIVEYLYSRAGHIEKKKLKSIAWALHMEEPKMIDVLTNYGLFVETETEYYSKRVDAELKSYDDTLQRMKRIGKAGGKASAKAKGQPNGEPDAQAHSQAHAKADGEAHGRANAQANAQQDKIRLDKIRLDKIKEDEGAAAQDSPFGEKKPWDLQNCGYVF